MSPAAHHTINVRVDAVSWMKIANPDLTVEEAVSKLTALGNEIVEVDHEGRRICVLDTTKEN